MYRYGAYGLGIHSELPLPELIAGDTSPDVHVREGKVAAVTPSVGSPLYRYWSTCGGTYLYWKNVGTCVVRDGREIVVDRAGGAEKQRLRQLVLGVALGALLYQRGLLVLHGSAVAVDGNAAVFLGPRGWGKSTLAAALVRRGFLLMADDIVLLDLSGRDPTVMPGVPQLKLWPDAVTSLGADPGTLPRLWSRIEKRGVQVDAAGFIRHPTPLKRIYMLGAGRRVEVEALQSREAMVELTRNLYAARFGKDIVEPGQGASLLQCARLVREVSHSRLKRPRSLELLSATAQLIEQHFAKGSDDSPARSTALREIALPSGPLGAP